MAAMKDARMMWKEKGPSTELVLSADEGLGVTDGLGKHTVPYTRNSDDHIVILIIQRLVVEARASLNVVGSH